MLGSPGDYMPPCARSDVFLERDVRAKQPRTREEQKEEEVEEEAGTDTYTKGRATERFCRPSIIEGHETQNIDVHTSNINAAPCFPLIFSLYFSFSSVRKSFTIRKLRDKETEAEQAGIEQKAPAFVSLLSATSSDGQRRAIFHQQVVPWHFSSFRCDSSATERIAASLYILYSIRLRALLAQAAVLCRLLHDATPAPGPPYIRT